MNTVYLTESEYVSITGAPPPANFNVLELGARKRIDYLTASRVADMQDVPSAVKLCMSALIDLDAKAGAQAQVNNPTVTSFSTDGYSETYGKALGTAEANITMANLVKTYLYGEKDDRGIPLLYRGVEYDAAL